MGAVRQLYSTLFFQADAKKNEPKPLGGRFENLIGFRSGIVLERTIDNTIRIPEDNAR